jgi:RNA polymerase sigma-70 factor (ECF subfamily)
VTPDQTDEQLMRMFQRGDARAFETLMRRHRTPVYSFLLRFTRAPARAEDLTQETFLRLVKAAAEWKPSAAVRTWLFTIARNLATDEARRGAHRATEPLDGPAREGSRSPAERVAAEGVAPDDAAAAVELRPRLEAALAALPEEQREVFLLREHAGLSFPEIAEATRSNENTVKSRLRYALLALRERLAAEGLAGEPPAARSEAP